MFGKKTVYRVEYFTGIRWKRLRDFEDPDEAEEYLDDLYYFDKKNGDRFTEYRAREIRRRV